jgi:hypothetical protein
MVVLTKKVIAYSGLDIRHGELPFQRGQLLLDYEWLLLPKLVPERGIIDQGGERLRKIKGPTPLRAPQYGRPKVHPSPRGLQWTWNSPRRPGPGPHWRRPAPRPTLSRDGQGQEQQWRCS